MITRREAIAFLKEHAIDKYDFLEEVGDKSHYTTNELLDWYYAK